MIDATQIAHDLAIARLAGKQLPVNTLITEYRSTYSAILDYLKSEPNEDSHCEAIELPKP